MSLPRYPEYKDSGIAWLGEVPEHWQICAPKRLVLSAPGGTLIKGQCSDEPADGLFPAFSASGQDVWVETATYSAPGLVLSAVGARCGKTFKADGHWGVVANTHCLFPRRGVTRDFLWYLTNEEGWWEKGGTAQPFVKVSDTLARSWVFPPLREQQVISAFLDHETAKIDALIAEQEKLLALLAEKRQATISHAVTRGLDPKAPMKDSGVPWLGDVPAHWEASPLKYISRIGNGSTPNRDNPDYWSEGGFPWLNSSVVNQDEVTEAERFVTELALKECHLPVITPPAVLVGITGQGRTRGMAAPLRFEATINQHLAYIVPTPGRLDASYLLRVLQMAYGTLRESSESAGSTKGAITCDQLSRFAIPLPPLDEQRAIAKHIEGEAACLDKLSSESMQAITLLKERRSALIAAAVTGQIDVRGVAEAQAA